MNAIIEAPSTPEMTTEQAVEFVRKLSVECREAVFWEMLREVREHHGGEQYVVPLTGEDGQDRGNILPPGWPVPYPPNPGPPLTEEQKAEFAQRVHMIDQAIPISQAIAELKQRAVELGLQPTS